MTSIDTAILVLRLGTGLIVTVHGVNHARGRARTTSWFESIGFRQPGLQWLASTSTELIVGSFLILGLLTSPAGAGLVAVMAVAFWSVHRKNGFFIFRPGEGWEYVATLAMIGVVLAIAGPGSASIDHGMDIATALDGGVGAALVAGGLVAAAAQLGLFYRPDPPPSF